MNGVSERDIFTGDGAEVFVIDKAGVRMTPFELKLD